MSTLHTVNKSPFTTQSLSSCINHSLSGDAILLIEDGVYGALAGSALADAVKARAGDVSVFVLSEDADARGLDTGKLLDEVTGVSYDGFVDLVAQHDRTHAWL